MRVGTRNANAATMIGSGRSSSLETIHPMGAAASWTALLFGGPFMLALRIRLTALPDHAT
jgi:hypothetical protein